MILSFFKRIYQHPVSTLTGLLSAALTAGVGAAATKFTQTSNTTSWQPYAVAAASAAVPAIFGAFSTDKPKEVSPAIEQLQTVSVSASEAYATQQADKAIANLQADIASQTK